MLQVSFFCFLLLSFVSVLYTPLILVLAVLILGLQYLLVKERIRPEYPEDHMKYLLFFCGFEIAILAILLTFVGFIRSMDLLGSPQNLYTVFIFIVVIILVAALATMLLKRKHTYGTVLFVHKDWAGISIKSDLFARINEGNYAVKTRELAVKPKDRVKIMVEKETLAKPKPTYIASRK